MFKLIKKLFFKKSKTKKIIIEAPIFKELSLEEICLDSLFNDMRFDSLDFVLMILFFESRYNIEIDDFYMEKIQSIKDLVDCIEYSLTKPQKTSSFEDKLFINVDKMNKIINIVDCNLTIKRFQNV